MAPATVSSIRLSAAQSRGSTSRPFVVECYDGSYHSVDSNEASFKMAGIQAFKAVAPKCRPVLLEPLQMVDVTTPDDYLGDVMGDLSSRRGKLLGTEQASNGAGSVVKAIVPQADLHLYGTRLAGLTHGRGSFAHQFHGYEQMPHEHAVKVIAAHEKTKQVEVED